MRQRHLIPITTGLAILLGCAIQTNLLFADSPAPARRELSISDVALAPGNVLQGRLLNAQGAPLAAVVVCAQPACQQVSVAAPCECVTDANGDFSLPNMRGGVYMIAAAGDVKGLRVWTPQAAPPSATHGVLLVAQEDVMRGKWWKDHYGKLRCTPSYCYDLLEHYPFMTYTVLTTAIVLPIVLINQDKGDAS